MLRCSRYNVLICKWRLIGGLLRPVTLALCAACAVKLAAAPPPSIDNQASPVTLAVVDGLVAENRLNEASELLRSVDESSSATDWTRTFAGIAARFNQQKNVAAAAENYARAVLASENPAARAIPTDKKYVLRLAAGKVILEAGRADAALQAVRNVVEQDTETSRVQAGARMLLQIGSMALSTADHSTAQQAYALAETKLTEADLVSARLGHAWSLAMSGDKPQFAAERLVDFAKQYPQHADAPRAMYAAARCLQQTGDEPASQALLTEMFASWPDSQPTLDVSKDYAAHGQVPEYVGQWIVNRVESGNTESLTDHLFATAILSPSTASDAPLWRSLVQGLAQTDSSGHVTSAALQSLVDSGRASDAEHLVALLLSPPSELQVSQRAQEAACRWAGRTQRWSLIALAAEHAAPTEQQLSLGVARLFAESLMQVGRPADARAWWEHLVDSRGADDFSTLMRCAETSVAFADVAQAKQRIEAATDAADDDPYRETLLMMLSADLSIRQLNFDEARATLENVVRSLTEIGSLRPRAQWLIGETYYMQHRFAEAVNAYRTVESIEPAGEWIAASLVQAGKSFEQLGRTRDAAVCYSTLLSRHADSPHAEDARRRLAALPASGDSSIRR